MKTAGFDLSTSPMAGPNGPDGLTNFLRRTVTVREDVDQAHMCTTLGHELAHVLMHHPAGFVDGQTSGCRGDAEVEAESVAYLVATVHGIDADDYTFPYVAGWIGRNKASTVLEATGKRVLATAHDILEQVGTSMATALDDNDTTERPSLVLSRAGWCTYCSFWHCEMLICRAPSCSIAGQPRAGRLLPGGSAGRS